MSPLEDNPLIQRLMTTADSHHLELEGPPEDGNTSGVLVAKGVTMIILCAVSTCMGILPMQMAKCLKWNTADVGNPRYQRLSIQRLKFPSDNYRCPSRYGGSWGAKDER